MRPFYLLFITLISTLQLLGQQITEASLSLEPLDLSEEEPFLDLRMDITVDSLFHVFKINSFDKFEILNPRGETIWEVDEFQPVISIPKNAVNCDVCSIRLADDHGTLETLWLPRIEW